METTDSLQRKARFFYQIVHGTDAGFDNVSQQIRDGWLRLASQVQLQKETRWHPDAAEALQHLNKITGRNFRETDSNMRYISARLNESGVDLAGVKLMIERKAKEWMGTSMEEYLRPLTLFNASKFDGYYASRLAPLPNREPTFHPTTVLKAVRDQIDRHPANTDSISFQPKCTAQQKRELQQLQGRERAILRVIAQGTISTNNLTNLQHGRQLGSATATETIAATEQFESLAKQTAASIAARSAAPPAKLD